MKKTLVLGASIKEERYSNKAIRALRKHKIETVAIGNKEGKVLDVDIEKAQIAYENIDTVSMYLSAKNQQDYEQYILDLKPQRIIFNPGAENLSFMEEASLLDIQTMEACTLVMLATNQY